MKAVILVSIALLIGVVIFLVVSGEDSEEPSTPENSLLFTYYSDNTAADGSRVEGEVYTDGSIQQTVIPGGLCPEGECGEPEKKELSVREGYLEDLSLNLEKCSSTAPKPAGELVYGKLVIAYNQKSFIIDNSVACTIVLTALGV